MPIITRKHQDGITTRLLNRPEKHNTINWEITCSIGVGLTATGADAESRGAMVRGNGGRCTSKHDLREVSSRGPQYTLIKNDITWEETFRTFIT